MRSVYGDVGNVASNWAVLYAGKPEKVECAESTAANC